MAGPTAKFLADFSSFYDAVTKANLSLNSFEANSHKVEDQLNKVANAFQGQKIIQQATITVEAIERIGGASTLTAQEQAKVNAQVSEAIAKYTALGKTAPKAMVDLEKATRQVDDQNKQTGSSLKTLMGSISGLAGAVGIGFSIGAVVSFGKSVFDTASHIKDLSDELGISTDAVQGFGYAAAQGGSNMDAVAGAIDKMNVNLAGGSKSTVEALDKAGLKFADIRMMKPEDAFLAIADAVKDIEDPMTQARVVTELYGKKALELLPAIREGMRDTANAASKMTEDQIKKLEAAQQAWENLGNKVTIITGGIIADAMKATESWRNFANWLPKGLGGFGQGGTLPEPKDVNLPDEKKRPPLVPPKTAEEIAAAEAAAKKYAEALAAVAAAQIPLTAAQERSVAMMDKQGISASTIAAVLKVSDVAVSNYTESLKNSAAVAKSWDDLHKDMAATAHALTVSGIDKIQANAQKEADVKVNAQQAMFKELEKMRVDDLQSRMTDHDRAVDMILREKERSLSIYRDQFGEGSVLFQQYADAIEQKSATAFFALGDAEQRAADKSVIASTRMKTSWTSAIDSIASMSQAMTGLGTVTSGVFGQMMNLSGSVVGAMGSVKDSFKQVQAAASTKFDLSSFTNMASGIMGIASAAIAAGTAIAKMFQHKGRDAVKEFAESEGGFDALHEKLLTIGDAGEQLWIKLTQGVGKNNPQQAQSVIDEVTAALDKQEQQTNDATTATEEQAVATVETATAAQAALEALAPLIKTNEDQWKEWADAVNAQIDSVAASLKSLVMPTLSPGQASSALTPSPAGGGGPYTTDVYLDGQVIARSVAKQMPTVLRGVGVS